MKLQIREIGNSLGVIIPGHELKKLGKSSGEMIEIEILDDPNWIEIEKYTKEERAKSNKVDFPEDDFKEWEDL